MPTEIREVDNRVFLVGLDELYRSAIKRHERGELLKCVEQIATDLSLAPADAPVEGYYTEDASLTRYFRIVRALQLQNKDRAAEISNTDAFRRLQQVTESPIFGEPQETERLISTPRDAMPYALEDTWPKWNVRAIITSAYESALDSDRFSLVDLAALAKDAVVLAGLRESVVLYAETFFGANRSITPQYVWKVDETIEERAGRFVYHFNSLFDESLPRPCADNADQFWEASDIFSLTGRCVRIGIDDSSQPIRHYHWAIDRKLFGQLKVNDFWHSELWTTQGYRESKGY